jgi:SAM-dependent methyltransferase
MTNRTRRFPVRVENEFARRHGQLIAGATGAVLDLDDPAARAQLLDAMNDPDAEARFDAIVSVGQLIRFPDLLAAIRGMERLLVSDGRLLIVEPVDPPGFLATLATSVWAGTRPMRGFHLGRDVAATVRSTGFVIDGIERFAIPAVIYPLRHAVSMGAGRRHVFGSAETDEDGSGHSKGTA